MAGKKKTSRKRGEKPAKSRPATKKTTRTSKTAGKKSTSKKTVNKKTKLKAGSAEKPRPPKRNTRLSPDDLVEFRRLLLEKRLELVGDVTNLRNEALRSDTSENSGNLSHLPIHLADVGSDNWEQEFNLGLLETERKTLREIDEALSRIEEGTYGICVATQKPISKKRLRAKPWARYCIEYARELELGRAPRE